MERNKELHRTRRQLSMLQQELRGITQKDQEQDVTGMAVPVLDTVLNHAAKFLPSGHPMIDQIQGFISPDAIAGNNSIRAVDVLLTVTILLGQLPHPETEVVVRRRRS